jgi:N-acetylglucosaminyldiphosphoundecaprenol N-acetyl-beta-D-mannosaminyltransferase
LMQELCRSAAQHGHRIFLYGGREDTLPLLRARLLQEFPGLNIAGSYSPPFRALTENEEQAIQREIIQADADIVFVGIGAPRQELWMHAHRLRLPGMTLLGVRAAFDFLAGRTRQAPGWIQRNGFEWLFRLLAEPVRLWRRYVLITPRFLPLWALQWLTHKN